MNADGSASDHARKVLIVSTLELPRHAIDDVVGPEPAETKVVVPAVRQSKLQWLTNAEDDARIVAENAADQVASATPGETVSTEAGDSDPLLAIEDALAGFDATEVIVVTRSGEDAGWLEKRAGDAAGRIRGLPVTLIFV